MGRREEDWKAQVAQVEAWPRATRGYEADVGLFHIPGERDLYLDGVISLANPRTCFWLMVLVSVKMRNQISISAISQFMNSVLRSKLTSAKRSESTVFVRAHRL